MNADQLRQHTRVLAEIEHETSCGWTAGWPAVSDAIRAVVLRHQPSPDGSCDECPAVSWPCPTFADVSAHILEEQS